MTRGDWNMTLMGDRRVTVYPAWNRTSATTRMAPRRSARAPVKARELGPVGGDALAEGVSEGAPLLMTTVTRLRSGSRCVVAIRDPFGAQSQCSRVQSIRRTSM